MGGGVRSGGGGSGAWVRSEWGGGGSVRWMRKRIEVIVKMQKKMSGWGSGRGGRGRSRVGGGCEPRIEVIVKLQKKIGVVVIGVGVRGLGM